MGKQKSTSVRSLMSRVAPASTRRSSSTRRFHRGESIPLADLRSLRQQMLASGDATKSRVQDGTRRAVGESRNHNGGIPSSLPSSSSSSQLSEDGVGGESISHRQNSVALAASPSSRATRQHHGHVVIDIEDAGFGVVDEPDPTYLESYLALMYYSCMSPFKPDSSSGGIWGLGRILSLLQLILYWMFTVCSVVQSFASAKFHLLTYMTDGGLDNFANMGFYSLSVLTKIYSLYLFTKHQQKIQKALDSFHSLRCFQRSLPNIQGPKCHKMRLIFLFFSSFCIPIMSVIFSTGIFDWSLKNAILDSSYKISVAQLIWSPAAHNETTLKTLYQTYGTNLTTFNVMFGTTGMVLRSCSRIQTNGIGDLLLVAALTLQKQILQLASEIRSSATDPVNLNNFGVGNGPWTYYLLVKKAVDDCNDTFDYMLRYMHVENLTTFVYFFLNVFHGSLGLFHLLNVACNIIKISCTYSVAAKAAEKNEIFRTWVRRLATRSTDLNFKMNAFLFLDQMKEAPLGLGKGMFRIDENFMFRFLGTVGSVFVMQAEAIEKRE